MPGSPRQNIVAIDLGAESCRASLLRWQGDTPHIELIHRSRNAPISRNGSLHWDLDQILIEVERGLRLCGERSQSPIASIGVDGWAVDYARVDDAGEPLHAPFCYRDARNQATMEEFHRTCPHAELFGLSGAQPLRINTLYQLMADGKAAVPPETRWVNLPEYVLAWLGGRRFVAEFTNATHTGLVDLQSHKWKEEIFTRSGLSLAAAPELVETGTVVGILQLAANNIASLQHTQLIATACHDTASAVAAIPLEGEDWAYISSGTWSLVGTVIDQPVTSVEACEAGFTNLGGAGRRICFHKNVNGMWLLKQTLDQLDPLAEMWTMSELVAAAERVSAPLVLIDVDDPPLLLPGAMATRINAQVVARGGRKLEEHPSSVPEFASLIFHSLAARYAAVLRDAERLTGKNFSKVAIVGGGSLNKFLNRLTAESTGLEVYCGVPESATIGNFAIQLATLEGHQNSRLRIAHWARVLTSLDAC